MKVLLTGGTGYIGSAVVKSLLAEGNEVTAVVRSRSSADKVTKNGAIAVIGEITDTAWMTAQLEAVDGAIHTASPGDQTSVAFETSMCKAVVAAFGGSDKPYIHTSGAWVYGSGDDLTEATPFDAPALVAWRAEVENIVMHSDVHAGIVAPGIVYGHGAGLINVLASGPKDDQGALHLIGDGTQHWITVHVDDLADLYLRALEQRATGYYIGAGGQSPTVRDLGEAIAGPAGVHPETADETRSRLGAGLADALLQSQQATGGKARADLGWEPAAPSLLDELRAGHKS
jgi:nucleoside-diphosphate-sugar epimerase